MERMLTGRRVLVVEDEMLVLMMIEDMLGDLGCNSVAAAATQKQALALIATEDFDAAMLDMNLNGDESLAVADALAERGVPFVFATGYSGHESETRRGEHVRAVVTKPFTHEVLAATFTALLSRA